MKWAARRLLHWGLALATVALAGCESLSETAQTVREKFAVRDEGRTKSFAGSARATYEAVRAATQQMGYRLVRGGAAQGELEAVSGVGTNDSLRSARQLRMRVRLHASDEKNTQVTVQITEILEDDSKSRAGQATETPLRDTPQYEVFWREVQKALDAAKP